MLSNDLLSDFTKTFLKYSALAEYLVKLLEILKYYSS